MTDKDTATLNAKLDTLMYLADDKNIIELASIVQQMLNDKAKPDAIGFASEKSK